MSATNHRIKRLPVEIDQLRMKSIFNATIIFLKDHQHIENVRKAQMYSLAA